MRADANIPVLTIVGADEFVPDAYVEPDPAKTGKASPDIVRQAYDALRVDAGYLSQAAAAWFGEARPQRFQCVDATPVVQRLKVGGVSVAVVFFPPDAAVPETENVEIPAGRSSRVLTDVLRAARSVADADIRIGVSPWGFQRESQILETLAQGFDVLLGGGPGAPLVAEVPPAAPSLLWSRADLDGKSLMVLDLQNIPVAGAIRDWTPGVFSRCREEILTSRVPADPRMERLLGAEER